MDERLTMGFFNKKIKFSSSKISKLFGLKAPVKFTTTAGKAIGGVAVVATAAIAAPMMTSAMSGVRTAGAAGAIGKGASTVGAIRAAGGSVNSERAAALIAMVGDAAPTPKGAEPRFSVEWPEPAPFTVATPPERSTIEIEPSGFFTSMAAANAANAKHAAGLPDVGGVPVLSPVMLGAVALAVLWMVTRG